MPDKPKSCTTFLSKTCPFQLAFLAHIWLQHMVKKHADFGLQLTLAIEFAKIAYLAKVSEPHKALRHEPRHC